MLPAATSSQHLEYARTQELIQTIKKQNPDYADIFFKITKDSTTVEDNLKNLCRTIAHFELSSDKHKRFRKLDDTYPELHGVKLPFTFHLKKKSNGKIHLSITYLGKSAVLGFGKYKKVKSGYKTRIDKIKKDSGKFKHGAVSRSLKGDSQVVKVIKKTHKFHKQIRNIIPKEQRHLFTRAPSKTIYKSKSHTDRIEQTQPWYNGDLVLVMKHNAVPLTPQKSGAFKMMSILDRLDVIIDAGDGLSTLHNTGFVHRDVKVDNILVEITPDLKAHGLLNDFDLKHKINTNAFEHNYEVWDFFGKRGVVTENSDTYGLAFVLAELIFPTCYVRLKLNIHFDTIPPEDFIALELKIKTENFLNILGVVKEKLPGNLNLKEPTGIDNYLNDCLSKCRELTPQENFKVAEFSAELKSAAKLGFLVTEQFKNSYALFMEVRDTPLMKDLKSDNKEIQFKAFQELEKLQSHESTRKPNDTRVLIRTTKEFTDYVRKEKALLNDALMSLREAYIKLYKKCEMTGTVYSKVKGGYMVTTPTGIGDFKGFISKAAVKERQIPLHINGRHHFVIKGFDKEHNTITLALRPLILKKNQEFTEIPGSVKSAVLNELKVGQFILVKHEKPPVKYKTVVISKIDHKESKVYFHVSGDVESFKSIDQFYSPL